MILKQFPDINMVKRLRNDAAKPADTWMNVALNIKCKQASRMGVESPYSLFLNKKGFSYCAVNGRQYRVETDTFLFTQPGDIYGLTIDNLQQTEICNIHINRDFFNGWARTLTTSSEKQLDQPCSGDDIPHLHTQLYIKDSSIARLTDALSAIDTNDTAGFELILGNIVSHLLLSNKGIREKIANLPFIKASVRTDIYRRLSLSRDYIHSNYQQPVSLDELCRETGMSKFHFLRIFKSCYGITPYQYLTKIRMAKGLELLKTTGMPVGEISDSLGFEYPNSFIKAFQKTHSSSPMQYRRNERNWK